MQNNNPDPKIDFSDFYNKRDISDSNYEQNAEPPKNISKKEILIVIITTIGIIALIILWLSAVSPKTSSEIQFPEYVPPQSEGGI